MDDVKERPDVGAVVARAAALDDGGVALADKVSDLRADGVSWSLIASAFGVVKNSAIERFGCRPRPVELARFTRRAHAYGVTKRPRVSVWGRHVVADFAEPHGPEGTRWRIVRSCATEAEARTLATYLDSGLVARYVARPRDLDDGRVVGWRLPGIPTQAEPTP